LGESLKVARKNVFGLPDETSEPVQEAAEPPLAKARPLLGIERPLRYGTPVGAISQSLGGINEKVKRAEEIEQKLAEGLTVVEIDPDLIDSSFITDRMASLPGDHLELVEAIREHGQQVPILVRPKPDEPGRYQVAYGHRRLRALKDLGRKVRAVVRSLSDEQLVVAQGQENSARTDLTFIERARFAARLEERGFTREVIMAALTVDKAALSRMISIASRVPADIIDAIGPAAAYGRQRWQELTDLLASRANQEHVRKLLKRADFIPLNTDQRFDAIYSGLKSKVSRVRSEPWTARDGTRLARITDADKKFTLVIDKRIAPEFGEFVQARLQQLYDEFNGRPKGD
jgi:ParB family transcriptional regulator, chromosome partitioning protein